MKIEAIRIKNFKVLRDVNLRNIPDFAVFLGANGSGKSTFFEVFEFLKEALSTNVNTALLKHGGNKGFDEVRSRDSEGDIQIELKLRMSFAARRKKTVISTIDSPLFIYSIRIGKDAWGRGIVKKEVLKCRPVQTAKPHYIFNFSKGKGSATLVGDSKSSGQVSMISGPQKLKSPDILAIKGLAQFHEFSFVVMLGEAIDSWHISDIHINKKRGEQEAVAAEHLSTNGDNLYSVIQHYHDNSPKTLEKIKEVLKRRVPGIAGLEAQMLETGRILLKIQDKSFKEPFLSERVSRGTIRILNYLVLLYDPKPHKLLCVEEPENQIYHNLLEELAEEFRSYTIRGGQVFVSTHSPDFLNAVELNEVFLLVKKDGYTTIAPAAKDKQVKRYMDNGDKMGHLWTEGFFREVGP